MSNLESVSDLDVCLSMDCSEPWGKNCHKQLAYHRFKEVKFSFESPLKPILFPKTVFLRFLSRMGAHCRILPQLCKVKLKYNTS